MRPALLKIFTFVFLVVSAYALVLTIALYAHFVGSLGIPQAIMIIAATLALARWLEPRG